jgi:hypothetical protein
MGQILLWVGLIEMLAGWPAMMERVNDPSAIPGDFKFDPLGLGKGDKMARKQVCFAFLLGLFCGHARSLLPLCKVSFASDKMACKQLVEIKNGRLAMLAVSGIVHHTLITGKGPLG